jgi:hypothetical protein
MSEVREYVEALRDHWNDHYWRADHPEVMAVVIALVTGAIGLLFTWLSARIVQHERQS